jgi:hypothetical protein
VAGVGAVGLGAALCAFSGARLSRLGEVRDRAFLLECLADEKPTRAGLDGDVDLASWEAADPLPHGVRRRGHATTVQFARLLVESVERDLRSVHVESSYDRHWGLL